MRTTKADASPSNHISRRGAPVEELVINPVDHPLRTEVTGGIVRVVAVGLVTLCTGVLVAAQDAEPRFDVASIKANRSGPGSPQRVNVASDRVVFMNEPTRTLIRVAYPGLDVEAAPDWVGPSGSPGGDRFDIEAKPAAPATRAQVEAMLRSLLAERYKLKAHTETRRQDVYALTTAREDGRLGPGLRPAAADCATLTARAEQTGARDVCGLGSTGMAPVTGTMTVKGLTLDQLAGLITRDVRRRVVNQTGLTGAFDWTLTWTPQTLARPDLDRSRFPGIDPDGPTIFTALQEQLGLKLSASKAGVDVLVIDHIERPTEN